MPQLFPLPPGEFPCPRTDDQHDWCRIVGHPATKSTIVCGKCCILVHVQHCGHVTVVMPSWLEEADNGEGVEI